MEKKKSKILEIITLTCVHLVFNIRHIRLNKKKRERFWKQKKEKYYMPIFSRIDNKELMHFFLKLLVAEWNQQIKILPRIVFVISTYFSLF